MTQQEQFGRRLRQLRRQKAADEERDVEQAEVAAAVGVAQGSIARWENGRIPKEDEALRALAKFYRVSFVWLRYGEGPREPAPEGPRHDPATGLPPFPGRRLDGGADVRRRKRGDGR